MKRALPVFLACLAGDLVASIVQDRLVMTDRVYLSLLGLDSADPGVDRILGTVRSWSLAMYALSPIVLLVRTGGAALLVQLLLMGIRVRRPLLPIFLASLYAQLVLVGGRVARAVMLAALPPDARTSTAVTEPVLTVGNLVGLAEGWPSPMHGIERISLLSAIWCIVFVTALHDRHRLRARLAVVSVLAAACIFGSMRWLGWLYLTRIEALSMAN